MENIKEVFEDLVDEVVAATEDVACAVCCGAVVAPARRRLQESRQALREFLEKQMENR